MSLRGTIVVAACFLTLGARADWLASIEGTYLSGPATCTLGVRRCNCLKIEKLSAETARVVFDRHDLPMSHICVGDGVARVNGNSLVLCPAADPHSCVTIRQMASDLVFEGELGPQQAASSQYCGRQAHLADLSFQLNDKQLGEIECGP